MRFIAALLLCLLSANSYATDNMQDRDSKACPLQKPETQQEPTLYDNVKSGWNSFLDQIAPPDNKKQADASKKDVASKSTTHNTKQSIDQKNQGQQSSTLYEKMKSGWNSFLDLIAPVNKNQDVKTKNK